MEKSQRYDQTAWLSVSPAGTLMREKVYLVQLPGSDEVNPVVEWR